MIKQPTAIICLSDGFGGMETDAIKYARRLSSITNTLLIVKKIHFYLKKLAMMLLFILLRSLFGKV